MTDSLRHSINDPNRSGSLAKELLVKVPAATALFWAAKLATTAFGEAFSDFVFFNDYLGQHKAMLIGFGLLVAALFFQLRTRRYTPWAYWAAVTAVSVFGTMSADFLNKDLGMPLWASTVMLLLLQTGTFVAWHRTQHTLDIHSVDNRARESFYWLTVMFTFALGTAAGDFAADTLGLGTLASTLVFGVLILLPALAYRFLGLNRVAAFWIAYTITRPLGASFADWLGVPAPYGDGLQLGTDLISLISGIVLLALIVITDLRHRRSATSTPGAPTAEQRTAEADSSPIG